VPQGKHDKERRQRSLMEAATAVFAEHGYDAATTREVAERAGCSEGLIHRYFGGKRGLLLAVMESKAGEVVEGLRGALSDRDTLEQEIEQFLLWHLRVLWEHRDFMRVAVSQAIIDPEFGHVAEDITNQRASLILERLARHQAAGRIRSDVDLEAIGQTVAGFAFMAGFMGQVVVGLDREYLRRLSVGMAAVLSRGIGTEPEARGAKATTQTPRREGRPPHKGDQQ
jgi:AcrR family transcriptional regulator